MTHDLFCFRSLDPPWLSNVAPQKCLSSPTSDLVYQVDDACNSKWLISGLEMIGNVVVVVADTPPLPTARYRVEKQCFSALVESV